MGLNAMLHFLAVLMVSNSYATSTAQFALSEICPYTNFCTNRANRSLDDPALQPCCLPCSCNENCGIVDKCCPDVVRSTIPTTVYPCRYQDEIYAAYLKLLYLPGSAHSYRVIDGCPNEAFNNPDLSVSVSRCYRAREIQDLIFVTGTVSGYTYLNKHCALCNNENDYTDWALYLVDPSLVSMNMSFKERDMRILGQGGIVSVPPTQEMAMKAYCLKLVTQRCNVTGQWDIYDEEIERKCNELAFEFIYRYNGYANVYCFMCNYRKGTPVTHECSEFTFGATESNKGLQKPFSALLTAQPPIVDQLCSTRDVWDPFRLECTALYCPVGTVPQAGACASMVEYMSGYEINLALQIELDSNDEQVAIDYDDFADDLLRLLKRNVNKGNTRCGICAMTLTGDPSTPGTMFGLTSLLTTPHCTASDLLKGLFRLFPTTSVRKRLTMTKLTPTILTIEADTVDNNNLRLLARQWHGNCVYKRAHISFNPIEVIYCPSIHLNKENLRNFAGHGNVASMIKSNSVHIGNGTVRICMEDYISILKKNNLISACLSTFKNAVHGLEPSETPRNSASHQAPNYVQRT